MYHRYFFENLSPWERTGSFVGAIYPGFLRSKRTSGRISLTKDIYPLLAKKYRSKPSNVEHDIRTIVNVCWENHRERLEQIAGYPLEYRPTNSEFVDMIAFYLEMEKDT